MVPQTVLVPLPAVLMASPGPVWSTPSGRCSSRCCSTQFGVYLGRIFARGYVPDEGCWRRPRVDGAGELTTYARVALRMLGPGLITVFLSS